LSRQSAYSHKAAIAARLADNASQDMNKHYTHLELETVRRAVESISRLQG
jgi:hypothetical protein